MGESGNPFAEKSLVNPFDSPDKTAQPSPDAAPIFSTEPINYNTSAPICALAVHNEIVFLAINSTKNPLIIVDFGNFARQTMVSLQLEPGEAISLLEVDDNGFHLVVVTTCKRTFYINNKKSWQASQAKELIALADYQVSAICFNPLNTNSGSTGPMLFGTARGEILEVSLRASFDITSKVSLNYADQLVEVLHTLRPQDKKSSGDESHNTPITGIVISLLSSEESPQGKRCSVLITTGGDVYQYFQTVDMASLPRGTSPFKNIFAVPINEHCIVLPTASASWNCVSVLKEFETAPVFQQFVWLTGKGVFHGNFHSLLPKYPKTALFQPNLIKFSKSQRSHFIGVTIIQYHVLVFTSRNFFSINTVTQREDQSVGMHGEKIVGVTRDAKTLRSWYWTNKGMYKLCVRDETRDLSAYFLDQGSFVEALKFATNPNLKKTILVKMADEAFNEARYETAADLYSQSGMSFEAVALKLSHVQNNEAIQTPPLLTYLHKQLSKAVASRRDDNTKVTQILMISLWILHIHISLVTQFSAKDSPDLRKTAVDELEKFLCCSNNVQSPLFIVLKSICEKICSILISSQLSQTALHFAKLCDNKSLQMQILKNCGGDDDERLCDFILSRNDPNEFLDNFPLILKVNPLRALARLETSSQLTLNFDRLIQALIFARQFLTDEEFASHAPRLVKFLEINITKGSSKSAANYLLGFMAEFTPEKLSPYIETILSNRQGVPACFDAKFALKICTEANLKKVLVPLYCHLNHWMEAVDEALQIDLALAKSVAEKPDCESVQKALWLRIAQHVMLKNQDVKAAQDIIRESRCLKIEEILPFFPDFTTIDHFKETIAESLAKYNDALRTLKVDIDECLDKSENLASHAQQVASGCTSLDWSHDPCALCGNLLAGHHQDLCLFQCGHNFHIDCAAARATSMYSGLPDKLAIIESYATSQKGVEAVSEDCPLCGDCVIDSLDATLGPPTQTTSNLIDSWLLK